MAVKIKLKRLGKLRAPQYRIVIADARSKRDGRVIEEIGLYHPKEDPSFIEVDSDRVQYWLGVGAQPTEPVAAILRVTGDWQRFRGEPGAEGTLRMAEPKADKKLAYEAAAKDSAAEADGKGAATTPKKRAAKAPAEPKAEEAGAEVVAAVEVVEVAAAPDGGAVVVDEVIEVIEGTETAEGETVVVEDTVTVVTDADGDVVEATEVVEVTDVTEASADAQPPSTPEQA